MHHFVRSARRRLSSFRSFRRNRKGSVAIEFAALFIPFALLIFAILESTISFTAQQVMVNATDEVARKLRTGRPEVRGISQNELRAMICSRMEIMVSSGCPGLEIDLREYDKFADAAKVRLAFNNGDIDTTDFDFKVAGPGEINMLRVFYRWPVMTDFMRKSMSNLNDGKTLHFATATWRNEDFDP